MQPIPQLTVLVLLAVFLVLGFFAGQHHATKAPDNELDLNGDGEVTLQDFSIALYLVEKIQDDLRQQSYQPSN